MSAPERTESSSNQFPCFTDEETEAQRGEGTCLRSHSRPVPGQEQIPHTHDSHTGPALFILI